MCLHAQDGAAASKPSGLLLAAFRVESWLHWLRYGVPDAALLPVAATGAAAWALPCMLDVHRMTRAQARASCLDAVHNVAANLPAAEVAARRAAIVDGAPRRRRYVCVHYYTSQGAYKRVYKRAPLDAEEMSLTGTSTVSPRPRDTSVNKLATVDPGALRSCSHTGLVLIVGRGLHSRDPDAVRDRNALRLEVLDLCHTLQVRRADAHLTWGMTWCGPGRTMSRRALAIHRYPNACIDAR